jgi:hypothetical protein
VKERDIVLCDIDLLDQSCALVNLQEVGAIIGNMIALFQRPAMELENGPKKSDLHNSRNNEKISKPQGPHLDLRRNGESLPNNPIQLPPHRNVSTVSSSPPRNLKLVLIPTCLRLMHEVEDIL